MRHFGCFSQHCVVQSKLEICEPTVTCDELRKVQCTIPLYTLTIGHARSSKFYWNMHNSNWHRFTWVIFAVASLLPFKSSQPRDLNELLCSWVIGERSHFCWLVYTSFVQRTGKWGRTLMKCRTFPAQQSKAWTGRERNKSHKIVQKLWQ